MNATSDQIISNDGIVDALLSLPKQLLLSDQEIARAEQELAERKESLEIAEVNASLNCQFEEKDTAPTKVLKQKRAVAADPEVKTAQTAIHATEASIALMQATNKQLSRQFAGLCHIAELRAAQMNLMSKGVTK